MKLWNRAASLAAQTPEARNRLVDFLRAASILAVISGHWLLAAPHVIDGALRMGNMLELASFSRWLSWGFQVMPIFFLSGALFPLNNLPTALAVATRLDPLSYGIDGLRGSLIGLTQFGPLTNAGVLVAVASGFLVLGAWAFSKIQI